MLTDGIFLRKIIIVGIFESFDVWLDGRFQAGILICLKNLINCNLLLLIRNCWNYCGFIHKSFSKNAINSRRHPVWLQIPNQHVTHLSTLFPNPQSKLKSSKLPFPHFMCLRHNQVIVNQNYIIFLPYCHVISHNRHVYCIIDVMSFRPWWINDWQVSFCGLDLEMD